MYWYHPHIREDYTQELGLYGNIVVVPAERDYWPPVDRDLVLTLDDLLLEDGRVAPFSRTETSYAAMGRFGNVFLVGGDPDLQLTAAAGEVVRLWLTNTASTRVFNVRLPGARMKLVGGDGGRVEHEELIDQVLLAPSERAVVDVLVDQPGELALQHHTPDRTYRLARLHVQDEPTRRSPAAKFSELRTAPELAAERHQLDRWLAAPPDKTLALVAQMDDPAAMPEGAGPVTYACPMHPEVTSDRARPLPQVRHEAARRRAGTASRWPTTTSHATTMRDAPHAPQRRRRAGRRDRVGRRHGRGQSAEYHRDHALEVPRSHRWGRQYGNRLAVQRRTAGQDPVDQRDGLRPSHASPFHLHGAGRFLVLARDGTVEPNLVWKDTVLIRTGQTVDILFDVSNPGLWMAHCHIAEHMQSGMMFSFSVSRR